MATLGTFAAFSSRAFTGSGQFSLASVKFPTGGNYIIDDDGFGNRVHIFTSSGTFAIPSDAITSGSVSAQIFVVGGGGDAGGLPYYNTNGTINPDNAGGGGGGGSIVYASDYTMTRGMSFSVTVGAAGGTSIFEGLHAALGGGNGGTSDNFSRGEPGGRGGGGSWQNGRPSGPRASAGSDRHPGYKYGTSGTAAPANYSQISTPALGPAYTSNVSCTIPITYADSMHGVGNHQYGSSTGAPDATVPGLASDSPYGRSFRSRGGGGASWSGGWGGQGVLTNFFTANQATYEWFGAGGHGKPGFEYTSIGTYPNGQVWRDFGHSDDGTAYSSGFVASSTPADRKFLSSYQNQYVEDYRVAGHAGVGSGGGFFYSTPKYDNGQDGKIRIAYDLNAYPGGAPAASANIFGGTITTSANGRYRYHTWTADAERVGTSANSQTYYISGYRPYYYGNPNSFGTRTEWPLKSNPYGSVANTTPFYYYGDIPFVEGFFKYLVVAGGGARGRGASGTDAESTSYDEMHYGGGGAGGIKFGTFNRESRTPTVRNIETLNDNLGNTQSDGSSTRMYTDYFDYRPGYVEVRANSMLNQKLDNHLYDYVDMSINRDPNRDSRERNGRIRLKGNNANGSGQQVYLLRNVSDGTLDNGVWGNSTDGSESTMPHKDRAWFVFYSHGTSPGDPSNFFGESAIYLTNYDGYFYDNYFKVVISGTNNFESSIPGTGSAGNYVRSHTKGNWTGPALGAAPYWNGTISGAQRTSYFQANVPTGYHPATGEAYYNMVIVEQKLPKWNGQSSRWSNFMSNVVDKYGYGTGPNSDGHPGGATSNYNPTDVPAKVKGLQNVDNNWERSVNGINGSTVGAGNGDRITIQYVLQYGNDSTKRKFELRDGTSEGISVPAGWKIISNQSTHRSDTNMHNGTTECMTGTQYDTRIRLFTWALRKLVVRRIFVHDVQVGKGGGAGRISPWRYRSGGPSCLHRMDSDNPGERFAGGGGAGGHRGYIGTTTEGAAVDGQSVGDYYQGQSQQLRNDRAGQGYPEYGSNDFADSPWGASGGGAWRQTDQGTQATTRDSQPSSSYGGVSQGVEAYGGGGTGGGSVNTRGDSTIIFYGAPRNNFTSEGRKNNNGLNYNGNVSHGYGGRGGFGGLNNSYPWTYDVKSITCGPTTYYYSLYMDVYPHNANFAAGGGGGAQADGGNAQIALRYGGNGGDGYTSSITGIPIVYGYGGGAFGRLRNGTPGNSLPPNPTDQTAPVGAPAGAPLAPAYLPFGSGGGWSAGKQEGGGADGGDTKYYPGSGPWPASYTVNIGEDHMDAMRFWYTPSPSMPAPQKGDVGRPYGGKQGVVIVSYSKGPFIYPA